MKGAMTAVSSEKQYDVAISFQVEDLTIAEALYSKLSEGFEVFSPLVDKKTWQVQTGPN